MGRRRSIEWSARSLDEKSLDFSNGVILNEKFMLHNNDKTINLFKQRLVE